MRDGGVESGSWDATRNVDKRNVKDNKEK